MWVGPNHGNRFEIFFQRQEILLVLEEHDSFSSDSEGKILMLLRMHDAHGLVRVYVRMLKQSQAKFLPQETVYGPVDKGNGHPPFFDILHEGTHISGLIGNV